MNLKIVAVITICFIIGITSLYFVNDQYLSENDKEKKYIKMLENLEINSKKIYLLGNSRTGVLDQKYIQNYLKKNNVEADVYKLAIPGTRPHDRLYIVETIISSKPQLVFYGLDIRDFQKRQIDRGFEKPPGFVIDPKLFFENLIDVPRVLSIDLSNFKNPKLTSLKIIDSMFPKVKALTSEDLLREEALSKINHSSSMTHKELQDLVPFQGYKGKVTSNNNLHIESIKKINNLLKENDIKFIIFIVPRPQEFINSIPENEKQTFFSILEELRVKEGIKIITLFDKYSNLKIFSELNHVTQGKEGLIFSKDISKIIIMELDP